MTYVQRHESSSSWLGDGRLIRTGKKMPNRPLEDNSALLKLKQDMIDQAKAQKSQKAVASQSVSKSYYGGKTVKSGNKYISIPAQQVEAQGKRRAAQSAERIRIQASKRGNVTVFDAAKGAYVSATPAEAKVIQAANNKVLAKKVLSKKTNLNSATIDNYLGLNRPAKSAKESMGVFVKRDIENTLSKKTSFSSSVIDHNLGLNRAAKSAEESAAAFIEHSLTPTEKVVEETTKKGGFLTSLKNGITGLFSKAKKFFKSPKGKYALIAAAVIAAGAALWAYVSDRSSDKNKPTPTAGPSEVYMPKLNEDNKETKKVSKPDKTDKPEEKTETEKSEDTPVVVVPVSDDNDDDNEKVDKADDNNDKNDKAKVKENEYTVVKGDNLWNIAKQYLKDKHKDVPDYTPTNKEILEKTEELIRLNHKDYEQPLPEDSRKRRVLIVPDEKIILSE